MTVRAATPSDAAAMARIEAQAAPHPWSEAAIAQALDKPHLFGLVAEEDGRVVGQLLASALFDEGELLIVSVDPLAQGRGHGRDLLAALHATWADRGVSAGFLEVRADNARAIALYGCSGWVEHGRRPRYYSDGRDAILMRWSR